MAVKKAEAATEIHVPVMKRGVVRARIIGATPLFQNRMAAKAIQTLLVGGRKKTAADRAALKHDPHAEFLASADLVEGGPTAVGLNAIAIKAAMCTAALETSGISKTGAQRLLFVPGDHVPLFGTPQLRMDVVRSADVARTPDVRSRAFYPKWGAEVEIHFVYPQLSVHSVINLLINAGVLVGVGDYRQEKGKGSYGSFRVIGEGQDDPEWDDLVTNHGREAQEAALASPAYATRDTEDLMAFYRNEVQRRAA